jgi:hypothetical protein
MPDPQPVRSWCWHKRHDLRVGEDPLTHAWVMWCATCTHDPLVSQSTSDE